MDICRRLHLGSTAVQGPALNPHSELLNSKTKDGACVGDLKAQTLCGEWVSGDVSLDGSYLELAGLQWKIYCKIPLVWQCCQASTMPLTRPQVPGMWQVTRAIVIWTMWFIKGIANLIKTVRTPCSLDHKLMVLRGL